MNWICAQFLLTFTVVTLVRGEFDQVWMKQTLQSHFSKPRHHVTNPQYKMQAMHFIRDQFREYGLETHIDVFPTRLTNVTGANIIGILKGKNFNTADDVIVGMAAHYDTMRNTPGVDDNGAAVVAMLQAAKNVACQPNRNSTVIFAAFDLEEWEDASNFPDVACEVQCCGSTSFVNIWVPAFWTSTPVVAGVMVMDTIMNFDETKQSQALPIDVGKMQKMFPVATKNIISDEQQGDFILAIGRPADAKILKTFENQFKLQAQPKYEIETFNLSMLTGDKITYEQRIDQLFGYFMQSDHANFWLSGIPAIFITDSTRFRGYMKNCYHQPCDSMDKVTDAMIGFAMKTSKALAATVNQFSPPLSEGSCVNSGHRLFPEVFQFLAVILAALLI